MKTYDLQDFRQEIAEVTGGIEQVEVDPDALMFEAIEFDKDHNVVGKKDTTHYSTLAMTGIADDPILLHGDGRNWLGNEVELNKTTLDNLHAAEAAMVLNGRKEALNPFVANVKDSRLIGEYNEESVNPLDAFDACVQGLGDCGGIVMKHSHVAPNHLSCDFVLPANVDPQNVGDLSHAACKFETNGSTKVGLSIYRLACTNGMVTGSNGFSETLRQKDPMERLLQTTIKAEECVEAANTFLEYYELLNTTELNDIHATIHRLCASNRIGGEIAEVVIDVWESLYADMGRTLYSVTQAFTYVTSHGYGDGDNHSTLSDGQIRRIDNMLTATMVENASEIPHCDTCGAELA